VCKNAHHHTTTPPHNHTTTHHTTTKITSPHHTTSHNITRHKCEMIEMFTDEVAEQAGQNGDGYVYDTVLQK